MFSSLYSKRTEKLLKKKSQKISKKVLTYKRRYGNIRHVKRKDVKTDRQTAKLSINNQHQKKLKKDVDKLKKLCYS